jgi:hypothetical protein
MPMCWRQQFRTRLIRYCSWNGENYTLPLGDGSHKQYGPAFKMYSLINTKTPIYSKTSRQNKLFVTLFDCTLFRFQIFHNTNWLIFYGNLAFNLLRTMHIRRPKPRYRLFRTILHILGTSQLFILLKFLPEDYSHSTTHYLILLRTMAPHC